MIRLVLWNNQSGLPSNVLLCWTSYIFLLSLDGITMLLLLCCMFANFFLSTCSPRSTTTSYFLHVCLLPSPMPVNWLLTWIWFFLSIDYTSSFEKSCFFSVVVFFFDSIHTEYHRFPNHTNSIKLRFDIPEHDLSSLIDSDRPEPLAQLQFRISSQNTFEKLCRTFKIPEPISRKNLEPQITR